MTTPEQISGPTEAMLADGWIAHDGGPCPVPLDSRPGIMLRSGAWKDTKSCFSAGDFKWDRDSFSPRYDIIAYKPEQPQ